MDIHDICINCFKPTGGEEVCMNCGFIQTDKPKQICHLYPHTILYNRYMIGTVINNGGFGVVYKAYDMRLENVVAIKELLPTQNSMVTRMPPSQEVIPVNDERRETFTRLKERFMKEARTMAQFSECNSVVRIYDFFEANNTAYLVMEYLDGMTLRQHIDTVENKMSFDAAMGIMMPIMQALKAVHEKGVVHKDVSPDNIFICKDGSVKLIDFGAAQFGNDDAGDEFNSVVTKLGYTPPEQYRINNQVGPGSDIYSVAAVFYAILTGSVPTESIDRIEKDTLLRPSKLGAQMPLYAEKAIMKGMALKETSRFTNMDDFINAVTGKKKVDFPEVEIRKKKIRNAVLVSVLVLAMAAAVAITYTVKSSNSIIPKKNTTITLWYMDVGDEAANERWEKVQKDFEEFVKNQNNTLDDTHLEVVGVPEKDYADKLRKAFEEDNAPDIYQSVSDEFDNQGASLDALLKEVSKEKYSPAYDEMLKICEEHNKIAFCCDTPVIYSLDAEVEAARQEDKKNGKKETKATAHQTLEDYLSEKTPSAYTYSLTCNPNAVMTVAYAFGDGKADEAVAEKLFDASKTFNGSKYLSPIKTFTGSKAKSMYYVGMISQRGDISTSLGARNLNMKLIPIPDKNAQSVYVFPEMWSITKKNPLTEKDAIVKKNTSQLLLYFLLSNENGQYDITQIKNKTQYLPLLSKNYDELMEDDNFEAFNEINKEKKAATIPYEDIYSVQEKSEKLKAASKKTDSTYKEVK